MTTISPITPQKAKEEFVNSIPDFVIEAFNKKIVENLNGNNSIVTQEDIVNHIIENNSSIKAEDVFRNNWLNVEPLYQKAGWEVGYDKPSMGDTYKAHFIFRS